MRELKLQIQLTVDGFAAGPNGEQDWMVWNWDDKIKKYVSELTDSVDTIILGRKMAFGFMSYWTDIVRNKKNDPGYKFAKKMVDTSKVVFTKTMNESEWDNTSLATGDLVSEIQNLKERPGKGIIVYGGAGFVSSLIKENLIDEYHLFINPAVIGKGMTIFNNVQERINLTLRKSATFDCGIVLNYYVPA